MCQENFMRFFVICQVGFSPTQNVHKTVKIQFNIKLEPMAGWLVQSIKNFVELRTFSNNFVDTFYIIKIVYMKDFFDSNK